MAREFNREKESIFALARVQSQDIIDRHTPSRELLPFQPAASIMCNGSPSSYTGGKGEGGWDERWYMASRHLSVDRPDQGLHNGLTSCARSIPSPRKLPSSSIRMELRRCRINFIGIIGLNNADGLGVRAFEF